MDVTAWLTLGGLALAFVAYIATSFYWGGMVTTRIAQLEKDRDETKEIPSRVDVMENNVDALREDISEIKAMIKEDTSDIKELIGKVFDRLDEKADKPLNAELVKSKTEQRVKLREGHSYVVYRDSQGFLSVGWGHKVMPWDNLQLGDRATDAQIENFLEADLETSLSAALRQTYDLGRPNDDFAAALGVVCFQLGPRWPLKFPHTYAFLKAGQWQEAIKELDNDLWAKQTPIRVADFEAAIRQEFNQPKGEYA